MFNVPFLFLLAVSTTQAQPDRDKQESEIVSVPGGAIFHRWYGHAGRTYFIQVSDPNNPLAKWNWLPAIESGNNEQISHVVGGTAPQVFYRLRPTDLPIPSGKTPETADFDNDGISNIDEINPPSPLLATDPLNVDSDGDGLSDGWERSFAAGMLALGAPPEHWGANLPSLQAGNLDPLATLQNDGMTIQEIHNATSLNDYQMILHDLFIQAKRAEFSLGVSHESTVYDDGSPTTNQGGGYFADGSAGFGSGTIETWSRTSPSSYQLDVQLDPFAVTPNTSLSWFTNESQYARWTCHTHWVQAFDPEPGTMFSIDEMDQSSYTFRLTDGGGSQYYQFQGNGSVTSGQSTSKTHWAGETRKSKFRLYRPRPTSAPVDQSFLKVTTEHQLVAIDNDPSNIGWSGPPTTTTEGVRATIPAYGHTSPWIETTPAAAAQKYRSVELIPISFHIYPDSEAGPDKAHRRNLTTKQNETAKYGAGWDKVVSKLWSSQGTINLIDYLEGGWGNHAYFENLVKWKVDGVVQTSHEIEFGDNPGTDSHEKILVEVLSKNGGVTLDRLIITMIPAETKTKFDSWYADESTVAGKAWLAECPRMPTSLEYSPLLPPDRLFPTRIWNDPSVCETEMHPDAYFEIRAKITPGGHGHQVNFNSTGGFIPKGVSAGSADKMAPFPEQWYSYHVDADVTPFIWALQLDGNPCNQDVTQLTLPMLHEGAFIAKYLECRPPEPNLKPRFTPGGTP